MQRLFPDCNFIPPYDKKKALGAFLRVGFQMKGRCVKMFGAFPIAPKFPHLHFAYRKGVFCLSSCAFPAFRLWSDGHWVEWPSESRVTGDITLFYWPDYNFILILCKQWIQENHTQVFKTHCCKKIEGYCVLWGEGWGRNPIHWEFESIPKVWIHKTVHCVFSSWKCFLGFMSSL